MLRIGLTGGIAAGKSVVSARLHERGAVLIDADRLARDVVAPGTDGLAAVADAFGPDVLAPDGSLDRPALGSIVFGDDGARATLNGIVHPRVRAEADRRIAAAPPDAVVVQDIPLLVETGQADAFALVVVVQAPEDARVRRMVEQRGMSADDARARMAAQASDEQRAAVADVVLINDGTVEALTAAVDRLWDERIAPFEGALLAGRPSDRALERAAGRGTPWTPDDGVLARAAGRIRRSGGDALASVDPVAAVRAGGRGGQNEDRPHEIDGNVDLVAVAAETSDLEALGRAVTAVGFPPLPGGAVSGPVSGGARHASADPDQPVVVRVVSRERAEP
ncbi:dephospho-CoA kinase [Tersicoccus sp. MR15.9]|uniref:dephospho-CoA kinase n=1 Tax=Tersicoccus mangrovi TaxID=3121635 RepID=UPI002FE53817